MRWFCAIVSMCTSPRSAMFNHIGTSVSARYVPSLPSARNRQDVGAGAVIWDALKGAAEADPETRRLIVESAGIVVGPPDLTVCYDERGVPTLLRLELFLKHYFFCYLCTYCVPPRTTASSSHEATTASIAAILATVCLVH